MLDCWGLDSWIWLTLQPFTLRTSISASHRPYRNIHRHEWYHRKYQYNASIVVMRLRWIRLKRGYARPKTKGHRIKRGNGIQPVRVWWDAAMITMCVNYTVCCGWTQFHPYIVIVGSIIYSFSNRVSWVDRFVAKKSLLGYPENHFICIFSFLLAATANASPNGAAISIKCI